MCRSVTRQTIASDGTSTYTWDPSGGVLAGTGVDGGIQPVVLLPSGPDGVGQDVGVAPVGLGLAGVEVDRPPHDQPKHVGADASRFAATASTSWAIEPGWSITSPGRLRFDARSSRASMSLVVRDAPGEQAWLPTATYADTGTLLPGAAALTRPGGYSQPMPGKLVTQDHPERVPASRTSGAMARRGRASGGGGSKPLRLANRSCRRPTARPRWY